MRFKDCYYASGTVRQLKRKGKPWQAILKYKEGDDWKSVTTMLDAKGKKDAESQLIQWQKKMEERSAVTSIRNAKADKVTLNKTVGETVLGFLEWQHTQGLLQDSTYATESESMRLGMLPYIGDIPFTSLTADQVREWLAVLRNEKGYRYTTISHVLNSVKKTYRHYRKEGRITYDPTEYVTVKDTDIHEKNVLNQEGKERFVTLVKESSIQQNTKVTMLLALYTGMRCQELCGLKWANVNMVTETVKVVTVIGVIRAGEDAGRCYEKIPKAKASRRTIPLLPQAMNVLQEQYDYQLEQYRKEHPDAKRLPPEHYVCGKGDGKSFSSPRNITTSVYEFTKTRDITGTTGKPISIHDLRHTFATDAVASHMDIKSISSVIGHSSAAMTLNVYAAADEDAIRVGMRKLGEYLERQEDTTGRIEI